MAVSTLHETVHAHVCAAYFRALRLSALRGLAIVSLFLWYQAAARVLPDTVAWILGLVAALLAALGLAYGTLELRWSGRARPDPLVRYAFSAGVDVRDEIAAGLLCAWGTVSLFPCAAALGCPLPPGLLAALSPVALGLMAARIVLEVFRSSSAPRGRPSSHSRAWAGRLGVR
jgi:hypothetical protein